MKSSNSDSTRVTAPPRVYDLSKVSGYRYSFTRYAATLRLFLPATIKAKAPKCMHLREYNNGCEGINVRVFLPPSRYKWPSPLSAYATANTPFHTTSLLPQLKPPSPSSAWRPSTSVVHSVHSRSLLTRLLTRSVPRTPASQPSLTSSTPPCPVHTPNRSQSPSSIPTHTDRETPKTSTTEILTTRHARHCTNEPTRAHAPLRLTNLLSTARK